MSTAIMVLFLVLVGVLLKLGRRGQGSAPYVRVLQIIVALTAAALPAILVKGNWIPQSAANVVVSALSMFYFAWQVGRIAGRNTDGAQSQTGDASSVSSDMSPQEEEALATFVISTAVGQVVSTTPSLSQFGVQLSVAGAFGSSALAIARSARGEVTGSFGLGVLDTVAAGQTGALARFVAASAGDFGAQGLAVGLSFGAGFLAGTAAYELASAYTQDRYGTSIGGMFYSFPDDGP